MKRYVIWLEAIDPLLLGQEQAVGNYRASGEVLSGRTFRGAVAAALRRESPDLFRALFEEPMSLEQVRFGPFFPAVSAEGAAPPPPTAFSCKYYPGPDGHGVFDTLLRQYIFEVVTAPHRAVLPDYVDELRCPVCDGIAEPYQRFEVEPLHTSTTHVAINRTRRVAEDALLYTREGVGLGTYYVGQVYVPVELDKMFNETLILTQDRLRVGANRSRGMGRIRVAQVLAVQPEQALMSLEQRVKQFNRRLGEILQAYIDATGQRYEEAAAARANRYFTVDLRSEANLLEHGLPVSSPSLGIPATRQRQWTTWATTGGWHMAARLPRATQPAVSGTYLYCWDETPDYDQLLQLEYEGIGEMREQGFGQLTICDPVHLNTGWRED